MSQAVSRQSMNTKAWVCGGQRSNGPGLREVPVWDQECVGWNEIRKAGVEYVSHSIQTSNLNTIQKTADRQLYTSGSTDAIHIGEEAR